MVGGGMGRTHNKEQSFPKVAEHLGFVAKDDIFEAMKARALVVVIGIAEWREAGLGVGVGTHTCPRHTYTPPQWRPASCAYPAPPFLHNNTQSIVAAQRDHGNREIRMNARMKYLVHNLGIDGFRTLVEGCVVRFLVVAVVLVVGPLPCPALPCG